MPFWIGDKGFKKKEAPSPRHPRPLIFLFMRYRVAGEHDHKWCRVTF
jgi:hypothetical protein